MKSLSDAESRQEILTRLADVRPDTPPLWGKMNAAQMICHVSDAFLGIMGDKAVAPVRGVNLWPLMTWFVLYAPMKWPHGISTRPEIDQVAGGGTPPSEFQTDMRTLMAAFHKFTAQPRTFQFRPHPMFKQMSEKDWMRWGYLHTDHHLRQFGK